MKINNLVSELNDTSDNDIDWALPVLAPYQAIRDFKFKVKITPGKMKRGKAIKSFFSYFYKKKKFRIKREILY